MKQLLILTIGFFLFSCTKQNTTLKVSFNQNSNEKRIIEVAAPEEISETFIVQQNGNEIPYQLLADPITGENRLLIFPEIKNGKIEFVKGKEPKSFEALTHAELWHKTGGEFIDKKYIGGGDFVEVNSMRVPDSCTDHSFYIKYEGPGWESNLVGYRFYLDWRNAVDVFGKKTNKMTLDIVGQDGYDSYHEIQDWGMDVLKVGSTLGVGSIGYWNGNVAERVAITDSVFCEIISNGGLRAIIKTKYFGWQTNDFKTNFESYLSIDANSRITKEVLVFDNAPNNVCTGIYIDKKAEKIELNTGNWTCIATWGKQSLNDDNLGLFVIARTDQISLNTKDKKNYVLVLEPKNNIATYYFGAVWELEPNGISSKEDFTNYLNTQLELLNNPDEVL